MDVEQMKFEALERRISGVVQKVGAVQSVISSMIAAARDPNIPVDMETMKKANAEKYAEVVDTAQKAVVELETSWPV